LPKILNRRESRQARYYYFYVEAGNNSPRIFMPAAPRVRSAILAAQRNRVLMPPVGNAHREASPAAAQAADGGATLAPGFRFIPRELAIKCQRLIESYHAIYGCVGLPDMLWLSDARDIIERDRELTRVFTRAARSRAAKRANDSFLHIATAIVSLEVLARDFSGWGERFPAAKREAEKVLERLPQLRRTWLMDFYFFPPVGAHREVADPLVSYSSEPQT
jgi:hypothetical protein